MRECLLPLLTIAIPTYNRADYLQQCLESIFKQIDCRDERVEIVISDNGSLDNTPVIVRQYCARIPIIRYFRFEKNQGFDLNVRSCVQHSKGQYIHLLSDDDLVSSNYYVEMLKLFEQDPDFIALPAKAFDLTVDNINETNGLGFNYGSEKNIVYEKEKLLDFIRYTSYWNTYVSGFVIKKTHVVEIDETILNDTVGTWFGHLPYYFACLSQGKKYIVASKSIFINGRSGNWARYNFYDVFLNKYKDVLLKCCKYFNLNMKIIRICYSSMIKAHSRGFEYLVRIGKITTFKTKPKYRYILKTIFYFDSWRYFLPVVFCPKWILKKHYNRRLNKK